MHAAQYYMFYVSLIKNKRVEKLVSDRAEQALKPRLPDSQVFPLSPFTPLSGSALSNKNRKSNPQWLK